MYSTHIFYNRISFLYPVVNQFLIRQKKVLIEEVNKCPSGKLLEIGVGDGSHLPLYGTHQITGIDISQAMLDRAKHYGSDAIQLLLMDGEDLSFTEESFDYVVMSHVVAVTKNPELLFEQVYRVVKPGGKLFILNHFTPNNWLKYIDWAFQPFSSVFHFKSLFYPHSIKGLGQFTLVKQTELGIGSYFKLLIFSKP